MMAGKRQRPAGGASISADRHSSRRNVGLVRHAGAAAAQTSDAQDAAADVFLTAWRRLDELPEGDAARVWLYATARRVHRESQAVEPPSCQRSRAAPESCEAAVRAACRDRAAADDVSCTRR